MKKIEAFKIYRHNSNPDEKIFHDVFSEDHIDNDLDYIIFPPTNNDTLSEREKQIILTAMQWLGSPIGQGFLNKCGFEKIRNNDKN